MKKFLIAIFFALPVLFFVKSAYAAEEQSGLCYEDNFERYYLANNYVKACFYLYDEGSYRSYGIKFDGTTSSSCFKRYTYSNNSWNLWNGGLATNLTTSSVNIEYFKVPYFSSLDEALIYLNAPLSEFDDSISLGRFFYTRIDFLGVPLSDKYYIWWGLGNASEVKLEYYNVLTQEVYYTENRTNSIILQYSVFNPSDYNIPDNTYVGVRITPYDSSGNYGATDSLHFIAHSDITVSEPWSDSPYIEPVLNVNGLDDVRPYINKYTVTTISPSNPNVPKEQYSPNYIVNVDTTEIERLLQYIIDNMNNNVSDESQQIIINTPVTYEPVETEFDTLTFKNDFKTWKNGVVDYLMQFNGTPFGEPFAHLVTVILILSGLALALLIIKRL